MPVEYVAGPVPGYRWGETGHVYPVSRYGRAGARARALAQGRAIAADADPWRIGEPGAPGPGPYEAAVTLWVREWRRDIADALAPHLMGDIPEGLTPEERERAEVERMLAAQRAARALSQKARPPEPTPPEAIAAAALPLARRATLAAVRSLVSQGMPAERATRAALGAPPPVPPGSGLGAPPPGGIPDVGAGVVGIDIAPTAAERATVQAWAAEGADLIQTLRSEAVGEVAAITAEATRGGMRVEEFARLLEERLGITERHARLIARDQTAKLAARVTAATHEAAGVVSYRWRTVRDERVRSRHRELEGTIWLASGPGAPGAGPYGEPAHPGEGIQCRCYREPIIPED